MKNNQVTSSLEKYEIILREEKFGGFVFDPKDATHLELDKEGFNCLVGYMARGEISDYKFIGEVKRHIQLENRLFRLVKCSDTWEAGIEFSFPVFSAPSLLDFQITNSCEQGCPHCYASSVKDGGHVQLNDVELILHQARDLGVCQVALGGGEPLLHPFLPEILDFCRKAGLVVNITTSGAVMSEKILRMLKKSCGAVALSLEGVGKDFVRTRKMGIRRFEKAMDLLLKHKIATVVQVVLSSSNVHNLDEIVDYLKSKRQCLYGVIFLAFKPVGRGQGFCEPLSTLDSLFVHEKLKKSFFSLANCFRIGYDCCLAPAIVNIQGQNRNDHLEGCSAMRGSIGVTPGLRALPCTFLEKFELGDLRKTSLLDIWNGERAMAFRQKLKDNYLNKTSCSACPVNTACLGGCPEMDLVGCAWKKGETEFA